MKNVTLNCSLVAILTLCAISYGLRAQEIHTRMVQYLSGDDTVSAYLAMPEGEGPLPALILIHEWWGLHEWIKQNADEFARRGYIALALDLYRGRVATSSEEAHELMRGLPEGRVARDLRSAFDYLQRLEQVNARRIGCIGWCMGGGYALMAAMNLSDMAAALVCYGRLVSEEEEIKKIHCPVLGIFGENDRGIPATSVKIFERQAQKLNKDVRTTIYPRVGHAFMNPSNAGYNAETAAEAWRRIFAFLDVKLKR